MKQKRDGEYAAAAEAAEWHVRQGQLDRRERQAFAEWLKASPRHLREFLIMETLSDGLLHVDPRRQHDVDELLREPSGTVIALKEQEEIPSAANIRSRRRRWLRTAATAAGIIAAALLGWFLAALPGDDEFTTAVGEQRTIQLPDNSVVNLNTGSRLQVRFSRDARDIRLLEGEAFFKVQQDAARPFRVHTRDAIVQAVGTQFNIYRRSNDTTVAVIEGRVNVTPDSVQNPAALSAGEEARIAINGQVERRATPDVADVTAWRQRRLVFREDNLAHMTQEFNRYNRMPKLRLEGLDGSAQLYTGTFDADNPRALALLLAQQSDLAVEITQTEIVIRPR